jgi:hypothetical protein
MPEDHIPHSARSEKSHILDKFWFAISGKNSSKCVLMGFLFILGTCVGFIGRKV